MIMTDEESKKIEIIVNQFHREITRLVNKLMELKFEEDGLQPSETLGNSG